MVKITFSILITFGIIQNALTQSNNYFSTDSPYQLSLKRDLPLGLGAAVLYRYGLLTLKKEDQPNFEIGQFVQSDIDQINFLDRSSVGNWKPTAKNYGKPFVLTSSIGIPLGLAAFPGNLKSRAALLIMFYEGYYLTGGLVTMSKGLTDRYRPFTYLSQSEVDDFDHDFKTEFLEDIAGSDIEDSFFSGDAAKTAYGFIFFAKAFNDYFPDSKLKPIVWTTSFTAIGLQAYFRVRSGKHFPTDVLIGSLVGGGIGYLIPRIHKSNSRISLSSTNNGLSLRYSIQ